ncbi:hypothetical protein I6B53_02150 [Schaalia sp. 19OD2882]|uniref:hypothetical protein n=1 Tax=Schaalia sp. 19OD2882 TaxID=2794089 RepID=UPI001C1EFE61|nr:hypothetical protein [Schaalia sp. 19OD2882]QWW19938.1 hypothetical protein I6B53_02150 [Schaalia sp. 19OD2882]
MRKMLKRALGLTTLAGLGVTGCAGGALPAPQLPPTSETVMSSALFYPLTRIDAGATEICPIDDHGRLIVFSESVTGPPDGTSITAGKVTIAVGETFVASPFEELGQKVTCNGTEYQAIHILLPGVDRMLDVNSLESQ